MNIVCKCGSPFDSGVVLPKKDVKYNIKVPSGNTVTRVFCGNCGSAITHLSVVLAIQTGNFAEFAKVPITTELFVKDRWTGVAPISGAAQVQAMPS
ncbi:hypothetical protein R3P38DRAFT_3472315 [Favolaschia claudopus]|uniref:CENP-V/GFA domain-containing protein n=1 Tax=Favolaschia claudopus TaxID=2862362 RepID=A0AAV9ZB70_9AGAR